MEDLVVEHDKQECVGPALSRVADTLHVDKEGIIEDGTAVMAGERADDGDEETDVAPHSEEKEDHRQPYELLVQFGVRGLDVLLHADAAVFCLHCHLLHNGNEVMC